MIEYIPMLGDVTLDPFPGLHADPVTLGLPPDHETDRGYRDACSACDLLDCFGHSLPFG